MNDSSPKLTKDFLAEVQETTHLLFQVAEELQNPLQQLIRSQIKRAAPYGRAMVVLAFAVPAVDSADTRHKRIYLAAALELLYIAHQIHKLLLDTDADEIDKSMLGSTILTGDFCYSHSADLAVRTDSAAVVRAFSEALKRVSEGNLRAMFTPDKSQFDENEPLFYSGILAGRILAATPSNDPLLASDLATALAAQYGGYAFEEQCNGLLNDLVLTTNERERLAIFLPLDA